MTKKAIQSCHNIISTETEYFVVVVFCWFFVHFLAYCLKFAHHSILILHIEAGPFPTILGKGPWPKLGKMIDLTSKLGEINDIEHYKGSKIYPQNQVILDCIMPSIPLKHKYLSIILIWVIVSHK